MNNRRDRSTMAKKRSPEDEDNVDHDDDEADEDNADDDDEDEDDGDRAASSRRRKKKKTKRVRIMNKSGQTDAQRRVLRSRQRELHNNIAVGGGNGDGGRSGGGDDESDDLTRLRAQNNELWQEVRYTREAVLDSENVDLIASKAARQAEKIVQVSFVKILDEG